MIKISILKKYFLGFVGTLICLKLFSYSKIPEMPQNSNLYVCLSSRNKLQLIFVCTYIFRIILYNYNSLISVFLFLERTYGCNSKLGLGNYVELIFLAIHTFFKECNIFASWNVNISFIHVYFILFYFFSFFLYLHVSSPNLLIHFLSPD